VRGYREYDICIQNFDGKNPKGNYRLEDMGVDVTIILKWIGRECAGGLKCVR
jgi:hypothetical protein